MEPPEIPNNEDCCKSGCDPCIFDIYNRELSFFLNNKDKANLKVQSSKNAISQLSYTIFKVVAVVNLSEFHKILMFKLKNPEVTDNVNWKPGQHFLVKYLKMPCTRAYTPLRIEEKDIQYDFSILTKKYPDGLVSKYLFDLKIGEETLWRGPYGTYDYVANKFEHIIMICQGTGIAPIYSIIKEVLANEDDLTKVFLIYCCSCEEAIIFRQDLYSFKSFWNFRYTIFVNGVISDLKYEEPIFSKRLQKEDLENLIPLSLNSQVLLCGSNEFVTEFKVNSSKFVNLQNIFVF